MRRCNLAHQSPVGLQSLRDSSRGPRHHAPFRPENKQDVVIGFMGKFPLIIAVDEGTPVPNPVRHALRSQQKSWLRVVPTFGEKQTNERAKYTLRRSFCVACHPSLLAGTISSLTEIGVFLLLSFIVSKSSNKLNGSFKMKQSKRLKQASVLR